MAEDEQSDFQTGDSGQRPAAPEGRQWRGTCGENFGSPAAGKGAWIGRLRTNVRRAIMGLIAQLSDGVAEGNQSPAAADQRCGQLHQRQSVRTSLSPLDCRFAG